MNKFRFKKESITLSKWQMWLAYIRFDGNDGGKKRPVLITEANGQSCTIIEVSGRPPSDVYDVPVIDMVTAGLNRESVIQVRKMRTVSKESLRSYLGTLSYVDRDRVKNAIKRG
ncbi:MAG: type II toxin-antitoxin system PemK/MazF family toxin [Methanomassiliicoccaceae archaeon]|nr:type II toxin-antitoxin system PemK/MazF family toxin [Methanomassiliicoccaceae archaeon]